MTSQVLPIISKPIIERIIRAACAYFDCTEDQLLERSSEALMAYRRKLCFYLIKNETVSISNARIARRFNLKDPWHISCCIEEIQTQRTIYPQTSRDLKAILEIANNLALHQPDNDGVDGK